MLLQKKTKELYYGENYNKWPEANLDNQHSNCKLKALPTGHWQLNLMVLLNIFEYFYK